MHTHNCTPIHTHICIHIYIHICLSLSILRVSVFEAEVSSFTERPQVLEVDTVGAGLLLRQRAAASLE